MTEVPIEIDDSELIVRGVCHPYHIDRRGRLAWAAFWPPPGRRDVSVIRCTHTGADFCKQKAKSLNQQEKKYVGLAFLSAGSIKTSGADIVDSRSEFLGHADILLSDIAPPRGVTYPSHKLEKLRNVSKKIRDFAKYIEDSNPEGETWDCDVPVCC
jgi:hypothetical protein